MLRIEKYLDPITATTRLVHLINFKLECEDPLVSKEVYIDGVLESVEYRGNEGELVVKESFVDVVSESQFVGFDRLIEWFDTEGKVVYSRILPKRLNKAKSFNFLLARRSLRISYLQSASIGTPIETYVATLLKHYDTEVGLYIQGNTTDFEIAVTTETDKTILSMLNIVIDEEGTTVKDSILNQIT